MIERGRYNRPIIPRNERFCPHCPLEVEDEEHFMTHCVAYDRFSLFSRVADSSPQFDQLNGHDKFIYLMSQEDTETTKFLASRAHCWLISRLKFEAQQKELEDALSTL